RTPQPARSRRRRCANSSTIIVCRRIDPALRLSTSIASQKPVRLRHGTSGATRSMTEYPERRTTRAAVWSRRTAAFSAVLLITVWVGHHLGLVEHPAYLWVLAIAALLAAGALIFAAVAFSRLWQFGDRGGRDLSA